MLSSPSNQQTFVDRAGRPIAGAFTLIEILIVVVILGILGAIVMPQFSDASKMASENVLKDDLRYLRTQVVVFKAQHRDVVPGYPLGDSTRPFNATAFRNQLEQYSDEFCRTSATASSAYKFGPYVPKFPDNPVNHLATVTSFTGTPNPDGNSGWLFNPQTAELLPNLKGNDRDGTPYINY